MVVALYFAVMPRRSVPGHPVNVRAHQDVGWLLDRPPAAMTHLPLERRSSHNPNIAFAMMFFWISFEPP